MATLADVGLLEKTELESGSPYTITDKGCQYLESDPGVHGSYLDRVSPTQ